MDTKYQNIKNILKSNIYENTENIQKSNEEIQKLVKDLNLGKRDDKRLFTLEEKEKEFYKCDTVNGCNTDDFRKDILGNLILNPKYGNLDMTSNENALKLVSSGEHIVSHSFGGSTIEENLVILTRKINIVKLSIPLYELEKQKREELSRDYGIKPEDFLKDFDDGNTLVKYNLVLEKDSNGNIKFINVGVMRRNSLVENIILSSPNTETINLSTIDTGKNYYLIGSGLLMVVGSIMFPKIYLSGKLLTGFIGLNLIRIGCN